MKRLIAGNWKMNGTLDKAMSLTRNIIEGIQSDSQILEKNDFLVCPPYHHIIPVQGKLTAAIALGAQDCSPFDPIKDGGAYTGDISAAMIKDMNAEYVILGHSERRTYYSESNMMVKQKAMIANAAGLKTIICIGETEVERDAGKVEEVVGQQLFESLPETATAENTVIAYEPVWAIGTGKSATPEDIASVHNFIRMQLKEKIKGADKIRILYGGSVKPTNATEIFAVENVNGALIGGASLKADDFLGIAKS